MKNLRQRALITAILSICTTCGVASQAIGPAMAQFTTTLTDPYVPGVNYTPPNSAVCITPTPPVGCGSTPWGVTPGQSGPAPLMPWVQNLPSNTIDQSSTQLSLPYGPSCLTAPGILGPALQGSIPSPPSAQGMVPLSLQPPSSASPSAVQVSVPYGGVLPDGSSPIARYGRQSTQNFGLQYTNTSYVTDFGIQPSLNPSVAQIPQVTDDGPRLCTYPGQYGCDRNAQPNLPNSSYVNLGTGAHSFFQAPNFQARQVIAPY